MHESYSQTTTCAASQSQSAIPIVCSLAKGPRFYSQLKPPPQLQHPPMASRTTPRYYTASDSGFGRRQSVASQPVESRPNLDSTSIMLEVHGLDQFDLYDEKTWDSIAFEAWLTEWTHNATLEYAYKSKSLLPAAYTEDWLHLNKFAPLARRLRATSTGLPWQFKWTSLFRSIVRPSDRAFQESSAHSIVTEEDDWASNGGLPLLALAWMCVECMVEETNDEDLCGNVARMAKILFSCFEIDCDRPLHAKVFREFLKRCVWEEFAAWWQPTVSL